MTIFCEFVDSLPVVKTVFVTTLCAKCYVALRTSEVKVNGLTEWAYRNVPDKGSKCEVSGYCSYCN